MNRDDTSTWIYNGVNIPEGYSSANEYISTMKTGENNHNIKIDGFIDSETAKSNIASFIKANPSKRIKVNDQDITDDFLNNPDKYDVMWYVVKNTYNIYSPNGWDNTNCYHVDGVLVLKAENTNTMNITTTFTAPTESDINNVVNSNNYSINIKDSNGFDVISKLTTTLPEVPGYVVGLQNSDIIKNDDGTYSQTYSWNLKLPKDKYTVSQDYLNAQAVYTVSSNSNVASTLSADSHNTVNVDLTSESAKTLFDNTYSVKDINYTVKHEYYTNNNLTGTAVNKYPAKIGDIVYSNDIQKQTAYNGDEYTFKSSSSDITVSEDNLKNVIVLKYDRTVSSGGGGSSSGGGGSSGGGSTDVDIPDNDVPQTNLPEDNTEVDIPDSEVPQNDLPQDNTEVDIPDQNVPQSNLPQDEVIIDDNKIPMADKPQTVDQNNSNEVSIIDEAVPLGNLPQTGFVNRSVNPVTAWAMLAVTSLLLGMGIFFIIPHKKRKNNK